MRKRRGRGEEGWERRRVTTVVTPFQYKYTERRSEASESLEQSSKLVVQLGSSSFTVSPALKRAGLRMPPFSGKSRDGGGAAGARSGGGARRAGECEGVEWVGVEVRGRWSRWENWRREAERAMERGPVREGAGG